MVNPYHWTDMTPQLSVVDVRPDLKISNTERGMFFKSAWITMYLR